MDVLRRIGFHVCNIKGGIPDVVVKLEIALEYEEEEDEEEVLVVGKKWVH